MLLNKSNSERDKVFDNDDALYRDKRINIYGEGSSLRILDKTSVVCSR